MCLGHKSYEITLELSHWVYTVIGSDMWATLIGLNHVFQRDDGLLDHITEGLGIRF